MGFELYSHEFERGEEMLEGMCGNYLIIECVVIIELLNIGNNFKECCVTLKKLVWGLLKEKKMTN